MRTWRQHFNVIAYLLAIPAIMACQTDPVGPTTSNDAGSLPDSEQLHEDVDQARVEKARAQSPRFLVR